jgi:hypothetical protein
VKRTTVAISVLAVAVPVVGLGVGFGQKPQVITHTVAAQAVRVPGPVKTVRVPVPGPTKTVTVVEVPAAASAPPVSNPQFADSTAVVTQFYADINAQDYPGAWSLGGDNIGGSNYAAWMNGYATTSSVSLGTFSTWGSSQVQAALYATQNDGSVKTFEGTYTVAGGVITAASIAQTS